MSREVRREAGPATLPTSEQPRAETEADEATTPQGLKEMTKGPSVRTPEVASHSRVTKFCGSQVRGGLIGSIGFELVEPSGDVGDPAAEAGTPRVGQEAVVHVGNDLVLHVDSGIEELRVEALA